jgi:hypothetical protein
MIDGLVFNANISSISAILWCYIYYFYHQFYVLYWSVNSNFRLAYVIDTNYLYLDSHKCQYLIFWIIHEYKTLISVSNNNKTDRGLDCWSSEHRVKMWKYFIMIHTYITGKAEKIQQSPSIFVMSETQKSFFFLLM